MNCFASEYALLLKKVFNNGVCRRPRGITTADLGFTTLVLWYPGAPVLPIGTGRSISTSVAAIEALQFIAGEMRPDLLVKASPRFADFMEPSHDGAEPQFWGGYGHRVRGQMQAVVNKLYDDPDTRQAVVTLWNPERDNTPGKRDYPCTIGMQFSIEKGYLNLNVIMRSNDAWLGLPYDVFVFTQVQKTVAHVMNLNVGIYRHSTWSLHLYESDFSKVESVSNNVLMDYQPGGINTATWEEAQTIAQLLLNGERFNIDNDKGPDWVTWYVNALAPVMG